jgi:uncharacterized protein (UPF0548 family)
LFRLIRPSEAEIGTFLSSQKHSPFSYVEVGASAHSVPRGYTIHRHTTQLGRGRPTWLRAMQAVRDWTMFDVPFLKVYPANAPIKAGIEVAVIVNHFGFYSMNACRIVYVVDEEKLVKRFGFAYGTLNDHAESGEERFTVEWHGADDRVSYEILAFTRPRAALAKLASPLSRSLQTKFATASLAAMMRAVQGQNSGSIILE